VGGWEGSHLRPKSSQKKKCFFISDCIGSSFSCANKRQRPEKRTREKMKVYVADDLAQQETVQPSEDKEDAADDVGRTLFGMARTI